MYDIIIRNGMIIDGTGVPMYGGDVGIKEGLIAHVGDLHNEHARLEIDAFQKYVAPGFIDVNNHSDTYWRIFLDPTLESLLYQGVTTVIGGNCGSSLAPLDARWSESASRSLPSDWILSIKAGNSDSDCTVPRTTHENLIGD